MPTTKTAATMTNDAAAASRTQSSYVTRLNMRGWERRDRLRVPEWVEPEREPELPERELPEPEPRRAEFPELQRRALPELRLGFLGRRPEPPELEREPEQPGQQLVQGPEAACRGSCPG